MDRIEFSKSIICDDDIKDTVIDYINETMALYNIVDEYNNIRITRAKTMSDNFAFFSLQFQSIEEALKLHNYINGSTISIYGDKYEMSSSLRDDTIIDLVLK